MMRMVDLRTWCDSAIHGEEKQRRFTDENTFPQATMAP